MSDLWLYLLSAALLQNLVLTTGFGSSLMMRIIRRRADILPFGILLTLFCLLTTLTVYPIDNWIGTAYLPKLFRPLIAVAIASVWYIIISLSIRKSVRLSRRIGRLLPLAGFNNVVIGVVLILNHQFHATLPVAIGFSLGSSLGFVLLLLIVAEGLQRSDHPAQPDAFRGLPAALLYMGILALALLGFTEEAAFV